MADITWPALVQARPAAPTSVRASAISGSRAASAQKAERLGMGRWRAARHGTLAVPTGDHQPGDTEALRAPAAPCGSSHARRTLRAPARVGRRRGGLDPYLGVLHEGQDRYAALAADLQEPFRFLCDRLVLDLFHRRRLTVADFVRQEKPEPMTRLKPDALKLVLGEWERRLEVRVKATGGTHSYRGHIAAQAARFAEVVRGERQDIGAFRLKW